MKKIILSLLILIAIEGNTQNINPSKIDSLFSTINTTKSPGAIVAIYKQGKIIYSKGFGFANVEERLPINKFSKFRIGSTSKQFTAACILILIKQGKLKYTDTLDKFYPNFSSYAKQITIRNLLNHTSGLNDYATIGYLTGYDNMEYSEKKLLRWLTNQKTLIFKPGDEFMYSNTNYWLLGQIVEKVSGYNLAKFAEINLFKPLQMNDTHFHNAEHEFKNRAFGYSFSNSSEFIKKESKLKFIGDAGVYTTVLDLAKWDNIFYQQNMYFLNINEFTKQGILNNGEKISYASGLIIGEYKGLSTVSHSGVVEGFRSQLLRFPSEKLSIVVLANREDINVVAKTKEIADLLLKNKLTKPKKGSSQTKLVKKQYSLENVTLKQASGYYEIQSAIGYKIFVKNDTLRAYQTWNNFEYPLIRIKQNHFQNPSEKSVTFVFTDFKNNVPTSFVISQPNAHPTFTRKNISTLTSNKITQLVGKYYSAEFDETFEILNENEILKLKIRDNKPIPLNQVGNNKFSYLICTLKFIQKEENITHFELNAGRIKSIVFNKM